MPRNLVVIGPPGTGKTQSQITIATGWFGAGASPEEVAFLAFTRSAAKEAEGRILDANPNLQLPSDGKLPFFRTLHSLACRGLMRERRDLQVLNATHMRGFAHWSGYEGKFAVAEWEDLSDAYNGIRDGGPSNWDTCLNAYNLSRISCRTPGEVEISKTRMSRQARKTIGWLEEDMYQAFVLKYELYKKANNLIDFVDMLEFALTEMPPVKDVKYVVVDECLPAGTPITMADGNSKNIEDIRPGDDVLGYDHASNSKKPARVVESRSRPAEELVRINGVLELTENHPVFVKGKGYVPAGKLRIGDRLVRADLRNLRRPGTSPEGERGSGPDDVLPSLRRRPPCEANPGRTEMRRLQPVGADAAQPGQESEVLLQSVHVQGQVTTCCDCLSDLRENGNDDASRQHTEVLQQCLRACLCPNEGITRRAKASGGENDKVVRVRLPGLRSKESENRSTDAWWKVDQILQREMRRPVEVYSGGAAPTFGAAEAIKSNEGSSGSGENASDIVEIGAFSIQARWQRERTDRSSDTSPREARRCLDPRARDEHRGCPGMEVGKARLGEPTAQDRGGVRWAKPSASAAKKHRRPQRACPSEYGVGNPTVHESGYYGTDGAGTCDDTVHSIETVASPGRVYNIGTQTENYFAHGILVHNCQDLSPILHSIVNRLFQHSEEIWWAGDANQAIFGFAAADARLFIDRIKTADHKIILRDTHRFGQGVVDFSTKIIQRARDKYVVDVQGLPGRKHSITRSGEFKPSVEKMLIVHRHVMGCQALAAAYIDEGKPFLNERGKNPLGAENRVRAFRTLHELSSGKPVSAGDVMVLVDDFMPSMTVDPTSSEKKRLVVYGAKTRLQEGELKGEVTLKELLEAKVLTLDGADVVRRQELRVFDHAEDLEYYKRVVDNGYSLDTKEIPIITTIHGSKGRQAPRVVIFEEMGPKCKTDMDNEHRLAYVAATRTEGDLLICAERKVDYASEAYDYPIPPKAEEIDFDA